MHETSIEYLKHIRDECAFIISVTSGGLTKENLYQDETLKRALVRSLEVIGEATKKIPADQKLRWNPSNGRKWPECGTV